MEKLIKIQSELKAPKNQFNKFGNYKYRSCEDILEALKPLLVREKCLLLINDELVNIGERYYVKATVFFSDNTGANVTTTGYAREEENKKGMDGSQITGASSSYARKYALNAMFLIDDTKDSDSTNTHDKETVKEEKNEPQKPWLTEKQFKSAINRINNGEVGVVAKIKETFLCKKDYISSLENAEKNFENANKAFEDEPK